MTYHIEAPTPKDKCYNCGETANIVVVADTHDRDTGHVDTIPLCDKCKGVYLNAWTKD